MITVSLEPKWRHFAQVNIADIFMLSSKLPKQNEIKCIVWMLRFFVSLCFAFFMPWFLRVSAASFLRVFVPSFLRFFVSSFLGCFVSSFLRFLAASFLRFFVSSCLGCFVSSFLRVLAALFLRFFVSSGLVSSCFRFSCIFSYKSNIFF